MTAEAQSKGPVRPPGHSTWYAKTPRDEDHPHHGGGNSGQRRGEPQVAVRGLDEGRAHEDEDERGEEGEVRRHERSGDAAANETDECHHMMSARARLAEREPVDICGAGASDMLHRRLDHVRQHGVSTAESHQRRLGEEPAHLRQRAVPAMGRRQRAKGQGPERQPGAPER